MSLEQAFENLIKRMIEEEFKPEEVKVEVSYSPLGGSYYVEMKLKEKPEDVEYRLTEIINGVELSFYSPTSFQIEKAGEEYVVRASFVSAQSPLSLTAETFTA